MRLDEGIENEAGVHSSSESSREETFELLVVTFRDYYGR